MIKIYTISFIKNTFCSPIRSMDYSKDFNDHKGALFVLLRPYMARFTNSRILCLENGYFFNKCILYSPIIYTMAIFLKSDTHLKIVSNI